MDAVLGVVAAAVLLGGSAAGIGLVGLENTLPDGQDLGSA